MGGLNRFLLFSDKDRCEHWAGRVCLGCFEEQELNQNFCWILYLNIFFFIEPVATEHQSHLLVLEVLLRIKYKFTKLWITENISYWYFTVLYRFFCELSKTTFVLIESCLNQCTLVTTVIIILLSLFLGMLTERMFYLIYTILYIKITVCSVFLRIWSLLGHVEDLIIHNTTIGLTQKD